MSTLVLGSTGLVGSSIIREANRRNLDFWGASSKDLDLTRRGPVFDYFRLKRPKNIILAAAKVGGIGANSSRPVEFLSNNVQIQTNVMDAAYEIGVEKLVFLGSSCIYPRECPQPIAEEYLLSGPLEPTNSAYAIAKISGIELIRSYRSEYGKSWISVMPTNLYGPNDNFDLISSHVLPALIRKFVDAVDGGLSTVYLWGTGSPKREFMFVDDAARAIVLAFEKYDDDIPLNIGTGEDLSILSLAEIVADLAGFGGTVLWDSSMPDGVKRKVLDISRLRALGFEPSVTLEQGIEKTIKWFRENRGVWK